LGEEFGLASRQLKALERGALLHDLGKIGISDSVLHKPGPLDANEWEAMRKHPEIGARIVERVPFLADTISIINSHQERWDGSGYPVGLTGNDIPLLARIFAIADAFDALTSDRPYRKGVAERDAMDYIRSQSGILFDPQITTIFEAMVREGKFDDLIQGDV
jgi:HD-GYP domain-containing protein (c-di-GMP phosphodiesterase class II)